MTKRRQILILYKDQQYGDSKVVDAFVVQVHESPDEWFAWLDMARSEAANAGLRLYNWGDALEVTTDEAMKRIGS